MSSTSTGRCSWPSCCESMLSRRTQREQPPIIAGCISNSPITLATTAWQASLLTAIGDSHEIGPANFYRTVAGPREQAELTSEVFMGNRLRCANCHNHPLDRWTQDDYHGLAAIFARCVRARVVSLDASGVVIHPKTGEQAIPRIPGERFLGQPRRHGSRRPRAPWPIG